ncbi:MAG TPA: hypothetical protein VII28_09035 [Puia sp.]
MSSPLEKFILENRSAFDAESPDPHVWEKISERMEPTNSKKESPIRSLPLKRWLSVAAAVFVFGLTTVFYFSRHQNKAQTGLADIKPVKTETPGHSKETARLSDSPAVIAKADPGRELKTNAKEQSTAPALTEENKEMYYYAKLIELKHEELKTLEKDEPLLYRQFSGDVQKLDSVYHVLKIQLPNNSNREQVIEAMISNLRLQIGLLNKQLNIIKQIKHSKKSAYEKAYKSV